MTTGFKALELLNHRQRAFSYCFIHEHVHKYMKMCLKDIS